MQFDEIILTPTDLLLVGYCALGTRMWFRKVGLDWESFVHNGLSSVEVEKTGDAMAVDLIKKIIAARKGLNNG